MIGTIASRQQQMADLVLRIQQHDAHRVDRKGLTQPVHHRAAELRETVGLQQTQLARLGAL